MSSFSHAQMKTVRNEFVTKLKELESPDRSND